MAIDDVLLPDRKAADRKYRQKSSVKARDRQRKLAKRAEKEPDYERAKARLTEARADLLEMEARERARSLLPADEVGELWDTYLAAWQSKCRAFAPSLAQRFPDIDPSVLDFVRQYWADDIDWMGAAGDRIEGEEDTR